MRWNRLISLGLTLAVVSTSAFGFQEQSVDQGAPAAGAAQAVPAPDAALAPGATEKPQASGTEVRIPGLGKLGVLPKMDFGLELLYGASEPKPATEEREVPGDEITIRGTIKQPF